MALLLTIKPAAQAMRAFILEFRILEILVALSAILVIAIILPQTGRTNNFLVRGIYESGTPRTYTESRDLARRLTWRAIVFFCLLTVVWAIITPGSIFPYEFEQAVQAVREQLNR